MSNQLISVAIVSGAIFITALAVAIRSERFREVASAVAGTAFAFAAGCLLFFAMDKEGKRNTKIRGIVKEIKESRKTAKEDKAETEEALSSAAEEEIVVHESAKEEQEELAAPKRKRTRLKA